jgi:hypothetical protein
MTSKQIVEGRVTVEQRPAPAAPKPTGPSSQTVPLLQKRRAIGTLAARFLEGTAWDEV